MKKVFLSVFVLLIFSSGLFAGGGWTPKKGSGYLKLGQNAIYADRYYSPDGSLIDITTIGLYTTSIYGEYGLSDKFSVIAYVPLFVRNTLNKKRFRFSGREEPGDELNTFGDMDLSLKYGFYQSENWNLSARLTLGLPTGTTGGGETGILQTGDGEFNQMLRLDASRPVFGNGWLSAYAAFNKRSNDFSDEWRVGAELGYKLWEHFSAAAKVDVVQSFFNGAATLSLGNTIFGNNVEYISPAVELAYQCDSGLGVSVSAAGAVSGKNVLAAPNYGAGVFWNF
jgi:hypothetical protein